MSEEAYGETGFECPHCHFLCQMDWGYNVLMSHGQRSWQVDGWAGVICTRCGRSALWVNEQRVWPTRVLQGPAPHDAMPEDVLAIYEEARAVAGISPRSAVALLRLALQVLIDELVEGGGDINAKIKALVKLGLPQTVQRSMDVLRIVGNNAVHPGQIQVDDDDLLLSLQKLINLVTDRVIAEPRAVDDLFESLPERQRQAIAERDATN